MSVEALENQLTEAKKYADFGRMAKRLLANRDYRKLITEEFLVTETARLTHLSTDVRLTKEQREEALQMAQASGHLKRYMTMLIQMGDSADSQIGTLEDEIEEARREEADGRAQLDSGFADETDGDLA